jgi:uncharacterized protein GlcG (DUF336 family)/mannose-6-phosphate isomerase-like protein (cupin superfamily)
MRRLSTVLMLQMIGTVAAHAGDSMTQQQLTLDGAKRVVAAAVAYAQQNKAPGGAIAVVDNGGHVVYVERLDGTFAAGATISIGKARTAVMFKRPTRGLEEIINKGRTAMVPVAEVTWFTPLQGGVPLMIGNEIVGGIGVSGAASAQQDEEIAIAGAAILATPKISEVRYVPADQVAAAYRRGESGDTVIAGDTFRVNASRRDGPGEAEIHEREADIVYVLEGKATFITGGELVESHSVAPGEIRGPSIHGGTERHLARGDVITVPAGVPHWFKSVSTPFTYYVVKSGTQGG